MSAVMQPSGGINVRDTEVDMNRHKKDSFLMLESGASWNPYLKYPRNKECYCGSGKKFKKCCLETEALAIPKKAAEIAKPLIDRVRK